MKAAQAWRISMKAIQLLPAQRNRTQKRPTWIIILITLVSIFLVLGYIYPPQNSSACYLFLSNGCDSISKWLPEVPVRDFTDEELASRVVIRDLLHSPPIVTENSKVAFMFLTPGALPFEKLWDKFFHGSEGRFSIYVHESKDKPVHFSRYFINREIRSSTIDKRKDDLLAEFLLEEQCRKEPSSGEKQSRTRKRSKDRTRISSRLAEEAEKYFEDLFSNFEDTDVSSFDGEWSETSSTFGAPRTKGEQFYSEEIESYQSPAIANNPNSVEMEGVILPWLGWETINDGSSHPLTNKKVLEKHVKTWVFPNGHWTNFESLFRVTALSCLYRTQRG